MSLCGSIASDLGDLLLSFGISTYCADRTPPRLARRAGFVFKTPESHVSVQAANPKPLTLRLRVGNSLRILHPQRYTQCLSLKRASAIFCFSAFESGLPGLLD